MMGFLNDLMREMEYAFDPNNSNWNFERIAIVFVLSVINCMMFMIGFLIGFRMMIEINRRRRN